MSDKVALLVLVVLGVLILLFLNFSLSANDNRGIQHLDKIKQGTTATFKKMQEQQITHDPWGHFLNQRQVFSPKDEWIVYDHRNDDPAIGQNGKISRVNVSTGESEIIYHLENQTPYGPGVGAAAYNPVKEEVIFIHGLSNAAAEKPYSITRRSGRMVDLTDPESKTEHADARDVVSPYTQGALRGGSHAHSYSGDGTWISYTYNDEIIEIAGEKDPTIKNLRTVGLMMPDQPVQVTDGHEAENFSGNRFSLLVAEVIPKPKWGTDQIQKAYEETWIGTHGYKKISGEYQERALAFLGDVVGKDGIIITEVFVVDIPQNIETAEINGIEGTDTAFPKVLPVFKKERITFTESFPYPGVQGPRQWLRSTPDGSALLFYRKDAAGIAQICAVSPNGGKIQQITHHSFTPDTSFSLDPTGKTLAYGYQNNIYLTAIRTGKTQMIYQSIDPGHSELCNLNWSNDGETLAYNRKVKQGNQSFFQVFILDVKDKY